MSALAVIFNFGTKRVFMSWGNFFQRLFRNFVSMSCNGIVVQCLSIFFFDSYAYDLPLLLLMKSRNFFLHQVADGRILNNVVSYSMYPISLFLLSSFSNSVPQIIRQKCIGSNSHSSTAFKSHSTARNFIITFQLIVLNFFRRENVSHVYWVVKNKCSWIKFC